MSSDEPTHTHDGVDPKATMWDGIKLATPGIYLPLTTLVEHHGYVTRDYRLVVLAVAASAPVVLVAMLARRMGFERSTSVNLGVAVGFTVWFGGRVAKGIPGGTLTVLLLLVLGLAVMVGVRRLRVISHLTNWITIFLWLWIGATLIQTLVGAEASILEDTPSVVAQVDHLEGDVVIVILDEYPNSEVSSGMLGIDIDGLFAELTSDGFEVDGAVPASYAFTEFAIPAFLMLDLPAREGESLSEASRRDLEAVTGGRNPVVAAFAVAGFRTTMVESGWSGLRCMETVDRCIARPWFDEVTGSVLESSLLAEVLADRWGSPFTHGSEEVITWIQASLPAIVQDENNDVVVIHLMLPHTPLTFGAGCQRIEASPDDDSRALAAQVECANAIVRTVSSATEGALATVIMGDHGSKLLGQTELPVAEWTDAMIAERMRTLVAVRGLDGCAEQRARSTVNVAVRLMRCLGAEVEYVPDVALATSVHGEPLIDVYPP